MGERLIASTQWLPRLVASVPATVHAKLLAAFLAIVVLLITLGVVGLEVLSRVNRRAEELVKRQERIVAYRQFQHDTLLPPSWSWNQTTLEAALRQLNQFGYELDQLHVVAPDDAEQLGRVRETYDQFIEVVGQVAELMNTGNVAEGRGLQLTQASPLADRLERLTNNLVNKAEVDLAASIDASQAAYRASRWVVIGFAVWSIGLALGLGYAISWSLIGPVKLMDTRLRLIASGDLSQRVEVPNRDELGGLAAQFNRMAVELQDSHAKQEERTRELTEALEQQTATAEILGVINSSPTNLQPVFEALAANASRLCSASDVGILTIEDDAMPVVASVGPFYATKPPIPIRGSVVGRAVVDRRTIHIRDLAAESDEEFPVAKDLQRRFGHHTVLVQPLLRERVPLGVIVAVRPDVRPFSDKQVDLLKTFADQAVIAIENVRLFKELEARNRDLTEALEQQTATSEVLKVISRSTFDLQPVLETLIENATKLCDAAQGNLYRFDGEVFRVGAFYGTLPEFQEFRQRGELRAGHGSVIGRVGLEHRVVHVRDVLADPEFQQFEAQRIAGFRTVLGVPMFREGVLIGAFAVWRNEVRAFTDKQIDLVATFADQAVIAIENVRLFTELQEKNRALTQAHAQVTEALDHQTAISEILRVISRSPTDVQPVFDIIAETAARLCGAEVGQVTRFDGEQLYLGALYGSNTAGIEAVRRSFPRRLSGTGASERAIRDRHIVQIPDVLLDEEYRIQDVALAAGYRAILGVPMLREDRAIGTILIGRAEAGTFSSRQIELLRTFADQAVIAIENVRLFKELQARTAELTRSVGELTALGDVGRAVSSTLDLGTVLDTIVARASQLAGSDSCTVYEYDEQAQHLLLRATHNLDEAVAAVARDAPIRRGEGVAGRMAVTLEPVQVADLAEPGAYSGPLRDVLLQTGTRALLGVPLLREDQLIGGLTVTKKTPGEFSPEVIELLKTFASQSALAIQNARLFREIEAKSLELEAASRHKSEFLANMSHELRTPLNAIIGFSEVLLERMFGEVNEKQEEYLKDIYASGQHLLSLINDILDLSKIEAGRMELEVADFDLPAAIDNALTLVRERASRRGIALHRAVDARLGAIRADERKIKQILLNLLSNAIKFTPEGGRIEVQAVPGDGTVEVAVRDTGVGIAVEDQGTVFEEFRQVGTADTKVEGTGLGLALCRKFVELHGGRIWVESEAGKGSTFTFRLPVRHGE